MTTTNKPTAKATKTAPKGKKVDATPALIEALTTGNAQPLEALVESTRPAKKAPAKKVTEVAVIKGTAAVSKALSEQLLTPKPAAKATKKATPAKATPAPKPPKQEMEKVSVMVSTETLDRLEALAKDAGINRGQLVRNILAQHCGLSS